MAFEAETSKVLDIGDDVVVRDNFMVDRMDYHVTRSLQALERVGE